LERRPDRGAREVVPEDTSVVHDHEDPVAHRHDKVILRIKGDAGGIPGLKCQCITSTISTKVQGLGDGLARSRSL
jgi:hypothetical protein